MLEVLDPEGAEKREQKLLEDEERAARKRTWLRIGDLGDGTCTLRGRIPTTIADRLRTYLDAFASPRQPDNRLSAGQDRAPSDVRLGQAFCALLEAVDPDRLPLHGGTATTVVVTIPYDGSPPRWVSAPSATAPAPPPARSAGWPAPPASSPPSSAGTPRSSTSADRPGCSPPPSARPSRSANAPAAADGCSVPATWCEAHHAGDPWCRGGRTDLADGMLLCSWHHHRIHDDRYDEHRPPTAPVRFHRRT